MSGGNAAEELSSKIPVWVRERVVIHILYAA